MKVKVNEKGGGFTPIKVKITLETEEELRSLVAISKLNVTIPECVADWTTNKNLFKVTETMLKCIKSKLDKYDTNSNLI